MTSKFQYELLEAISQFSGAVFKAGMKGTKQNKLHTEADKAWQRLEKLVERAVDKDGPLVKQTIDSIYLNALRMACNAVTEQKGFPNSDYWVEMAQNDK